MVLSQNLDIIRFLITISNVDVMTKLVKVEQSGKSRK